MGKNKGKIGVRNRRQQYQPAKYGKKNSVSNGIKVISVLALLAVIAVALSFTFSSQPAQSSPSSSTQSYPQSVAPVFYSNPTITSDGSKVTLPLSFVY